MIIQGHWKWHHSIDQTRSYQSGIVSVAVPCTLLLTYIEKYHHLDVLTRNHSGHWKLHRSIDYQFLLAFSSNCSHILYRFWDTTSSHMRVINHNWSATKQRLHPQSVAEISRHSVLSGDRIWQCETSSGSRHKDTDQCLSVAISFCRHCSVPEILKAWNSGVPLKSVLGVIQCHWNWSLN